MSKKPEAAMCHLFAVDYAKFKEISKKKGVTIPVAIHEFIRDRESYISELQRYKAIAAIEDSRRKIAETELGKAMATMKTHQPAVTKIDIFKNKDGSTVSTVQITSLGGLSDELLYFIKILQGIGG